VACQAIENKEALEVGQAPVPQQKKAKTKMKYDVVGKTIGQLRADMESGATTSEEITEAYLDRIEFYDKGQFGFHAYELVAADALEQAKAQTPPARRARPGRCWESRSW
jgi:amidase